MEAFAPDTPGYPRIPQDTHTKEYRIPLRNKPRHSKLAPAAALALAQTTAHQKHVDANLRVFMDRLKECERHINDNYDVDGLCYGAVKRLETLRDGKGARMTTRRAATRDRLVHVCLAVRL